MAETAVTWDYTGADPAIMLFTAAHKAWQMPILQGQSVVELGCNESDFLPRLKQADPSLQLTGVDARETDKTPDGWSFIHGTAWDVDLFPAESLDWVISLGALEHFGLGWYGDPVDLTGDRRALHAASRWLKPGGSIYFDVPCNPEASQTAHYRTYRAAHQFDEGWFTEVARGWSLPEPHAGTWVPQPTVHRTPYHYVAIWARKI